MINIYRVKAFCKNPELIENYELAVNDNTQTWHCHHRLETHTSDGERRLVDISKAELEALDMYYNRPSEELIFLTRTEHMMLHHIGMHYSDDSKKKMSEAKKDIIPWNVGKHYSLSEETKKKMSEARKGKHWKLVEGKRVWY